MCFTNEQETGFKGWCSRMPSSVMLLFYLYSSCFQSPFHLFLLSLSCRRRTKWNCSPWIRSSDIDTLQSNAPDWHIYFNTLNIQTCLDKGRLKRFDSKNQRGALNEKQKVFIVIFYRVSVGTNLIKGHSCRQQVSVPNLLRKVSFYSVVEFLGKVALNC